MHIDDKRIFLAGIKVVWLHDEYLYLVTTSAIYPDTLRWTDIHLILQLLVEEGNLLFLAAGYRSSIPFLHLLAIESRWLACRAIGIIYHTLIVEIKLRDGLARQYRRDGFSGYIELVKRLSALYLTEEEDTLAVGSPFVIIYPVVKLLCQDGRLLCSPVVDSKTEAIRLITRYLLQAVSDILAVRRIGWSTIPSLVLLRDADRFSPIHRYRPQVGIGASLLMLIMIGYETDLLAVRRELIGDSTPNHEYKRIIARSQILVSLRLCIEKDKVIASAITIARPMTVEQLVGDMRLYRSLLLFLHPGLVSLGISSQVGIYFCGKGYVSLIRRDNWATDTQLIISYLFRLTGSQIHAKDLSRPFLIISKEDTLSILAPYGRTTLSILGKSLGVRAIRIHDVDVGARLLVLQVRRTGGIANRLTIRRKAHRRNALHPVQILDGKRPFLSVCRKQRHHECCRKHQSLVHITY